MTPPEQTEPRDFSSLAKRASGLRAQPAAQLPPVAPVEEAPGEPQEAAQSVEEPPAQAPAAPADPPAAQGPSGVPVDLAARPDLLRAMADLAAAGTLPASAADLSTEPAQPRRRPGRPRTGRDTQGNGLPSRLVELLAAAVEEEGSTHAAWFMSAMNDTWDAQSEVFPPLPPRRAELPPARRTPRKRVPGRRVPVNFRFTREERLAVEHRQQVLDVESRSELCSAVVALGLGFTPRQVRRGAFHETPGQDTPASMPADSSASSDPE